MPRFVGDVHGKFGPYHTIIKQYPDTIQLGDMGVGFRNWPHGNAQENPRHEKMVETNARFIRGNHDNPGVCRSHSQWIADGTVVGEMMFVGGAYSIDKDYRKDRYNWWEDEELSHAEMLTIMDIYLQAKPRIMVTHDCPEAIIPYLHSHHWGFKTRTGQFFDSLWQHYQPEIWVHGHHHISSDQVINGTRFICLAELEHRVIE